MQAGLELRRRNVSFGGQLVGELSRRAVTLSAGAAHRTADEPQRERGDHPRLPVAVSPGCGVDQPQTKAQAHQRTDPDYNDGELDEPEEEGNLAGPLAHLRRHVERAGRHRSSSEQERPGDVQEEEPVVLRHGAVTIIGAMDATERHLRLLTETIEAVNSTLDLDEVLSLVASKVARALDADACFVYLYDERADELVLRATHGTRVDEMTRTPRMRPGEGITGTAAAGREPVMIAEKAHLDPRFKAFQNLPEDEYESILAVPILAREKLAGALNVRTRAPRAFSPAEVDLLLAIAAQVAQTIEHAKLYREARRRVGELEALARISEAVSESLYLEESLEAIVKATVDALDATGAAVVLDDGEIVWPEGQSGKHAVRVPLRWKGRQVGELVCDRDAPFTADDRALLGSIASHAAVALEHGRAVLRGVLAQEIHHRV